MATGPPWTFVLSGEAERDFDDILVWTRTHFGSRQANAYRAALSSLIEAVAHEPQRSGSLLRAEIGPGLRTLHMEALKIRERHLALYRILGAEVQVLRLLHDRMELSLHIPGDQRD